MMEPSTDYAAIARGWRPFFVRDAEMKLHVLHAMLEEPEKPILLKLYLESESCVNRDLCSDVRHELGGDDSGCSLSMGDWMRFVAEMARVVVAEHRKEVAKAREKEIAHLEGRLAELKEVA